MFGTTWGCGVRGLFVVASDVTDGVFFGICACDATLLTPSGTAVERGGGNGDIEMQEVDAFSWARYTRRDLKDGSDITCYRIYQHMAS
jgi:hypothetical protein